MNKTKTCVLWLGGAALAASAAGALALWSGAYDVGADTPHAQPTYALLEYARQRSVAVRAAEIGVPALDDPERVRRGAGNYAAMCAVCHLAPGMDGSELSRGLYPAPPNLSQREVDAAAAFWTIKHGIKASGMPAWGGSMDDEHIWDLVAFLRRLPALDAAGYRDWVARSDGHSHGATPGASHSHGAGAEGGGEHPPAGMGGGHAEDGHGEGSHGEAGHGHAHDAPHAQAGAQEQGGTQAGAHAPAAAKPAATKPAATKPATTQSAATQPAAKPAAPPTAQPASRPAAAPVQPVAPPKSEQAHDHGDHSHH